MPVGVINTEFANLNAQRSYPLWDAATGVDTTASFSLPQDFLVELDLPIHAEQNVRTSRFFLSQVGLYATGVSLRFAYQPVSGNAVPAASAFVPFAGFSPNSVYPVEGIAPFDDTLGKVAIGQLTGMQERPGGLWNFDLTGGRLDPDAVRPSLRGVSGLVVVNGNQTSPVLRGIIEFVAGTNCQIAVAEQSGQPTQLTISAISGAGLVEDCVCNGATVLPPPIRTINGQGAYEGNFDLVAAACVSLEEVENGLRIANTCAQPCCGCPELETITRKLEQFSAQNKEALAYVNNLGNQVENMETNVLASKLNDASCSTC